MLIFEDNEPNPRTMNAKEPFVITVSREVGSGGRTVGRILADRLHVRYCDKLLLKSLEAQFDLSAAEIERLKGKKKNWLADFFDRVTPMPSAQAFGLDPRFTSEFRVNVTSDDVFQAEVEILRGFAQMGSCVIAGRLGFFAFRDHPNKLNVFITASLPSRLDRIMRKQNLSEEEALAVVRKLDEARENYVRRCAGVSRYDLRNYDLTLSADGHSEEELADLILSYIPSL